MNWVLIIVAAILLGYTIAGLSKGFLKIIYSLVSWILILAFVAFVSPHIQDYIKNNTNLYSEVVSYCEGMIQKEVEKEAGEALATLTDNEMFAMVTEMLPETLLEELTSQTEQLTDGVLENSGIYAKTATAMADLLLKGISTLIAIILGLVASALISVVLGIVTKLPIIGSVDRLLGLVAGSANGLLIVWVGFYLVAILSATALGNEIIAQINTNEYLVFLYENNPILSILI